MPPPATPETQRVISAENKEQAAQKLEKVELSTNEGKEALRQQATALKNVAETDQQALQGRYLDVIRTAAQAEFTQVKTDHPEKTDADALKMVQDAFIAQGINAHFSIINEGAGPTIGVEAHYQDLGKRMEEQEGFSPEERAQLTQAFDKVPPSVRESVMRLAEQIRAEDPAKLQVLSDLVTELKQNVSIAAFPLVVTAVKENSTAAIARDPRLRGPQNKEQRDQLIAFVNGLDETKRDLLTRLGSSFETTAKEMAENDHGVTEEERQSMVQGAEQDLKNFDATKASEIEKSIMLARLQMRGIDTSNPDAVFKKPPELKAFEGTPLERGFYRVMGLIGFIMGHIEKLKQIGKPKEKTGEAPSGGPAGKEGVRKMMKEAPPAADAEVLATRKEGERDASKKKIDGDPTQPAGPAHDGLRKRLQLAKGVQTTAQAKVEDLKQQATTVPDAEKPAINVQLANANTALAVANGDVESLQQQLSQEQATLTRLEGEAKTVRDVINQTATDKTALEQAIALGIIRLGIPPGNPELTGILSNMKAEVGGNKIDLKVDFTDGATRAKFLQLCEQRGIDLGTLNVEIDTANPQFVVAKDAQAFIKALNTVMTKAPAAPAAAPAPAGPAAPEPAPDAGAGPREF